MAGDPSKAVRLEAAKAVQSLIQMQGLHGQPFTILALACLSAESFCLGGCGPAHWQCFAGIRGDQFPKEDKQIDVLLGLEHVRSLASTLVFREPEEDVQVRRCIRIWCPNSAPILMFSVNQNDTSITGLLSTLLISILLNSSRWKACCPSCLG